jgi:biotin carboxyl carrier protein
MKMQNEIKSPKAGRVSEIRTSEGATVTANQVLAVVE